MLAHQRSGHARGRQANSKRPLKLMNNEDSATNLDLEDGKDGLPSQVFEEAASASALAQADLPVGSNGTTKRRVVKKKKKSMPVTGAASISQV